MKKPVLIIGLALTSLCTIDAQHKITSPNKKVVLEVNDQYELNFSVSLNGNKIVNSMSIDLLFDNTSLFKGKKGKATTTLLYN